MSTFEEIQEENLLLRDLATDLEIYHRDFTKELEAYCREIRKGIERLDTLILLAEAENLTGNSQQT